MNSHAPSHFSQSVYSKIALFTDRVTNGIRDYSVKHRKKCIVFFLVSFLCAGFGNFIAIRGDVLENPITKVDDVDNLSHKFVVEKTMFSDFFRVPIKSQDESGRMVITRRALRKAMEYTEKFRERFGDGVISLFSGLPGPPKKGKISTKPHFTPEKLEYLESLSEEEWGIFLEKWMEEIKGDVERGIRPDYCYGNLVERDGSALYIIVLLERGYKDREVLWKVAEIAEEREIPWWERLWKADIQPKDQDLLVAGWPVGRGLLYQILNVYLPKGILIGILPAFFVFCLVLSFRQALISMATVFVSIWFMRGNIGILRFLGFDMFFLSMPIRETVYILPAFSVCIVQGISFSYRKFVAYNESGSWRKARSVDSVIFDTALISILGFVTLYSFDVRSIQELGVISAFGVFFLFMLSTVLIPLIAKEKEDVKEFGTGRLANLLRRLTGYAAFGQIMLILKNISWVMEKVSYRYSQGIRKISEFFAYLAIQKARWHLLFLVLITVAALVFIWRGNLKLGTKAIEYLFGTLIHETSKFTNKEGRSGFAALSIYLEAKSGNIRDPEFLKSVSDFQDELQQGENAARQTFSVVNVVYKWSEGLYGKSLPSTKQEARGVFFYLDNTAPEVMYQFWEDGFIRVLAFIEMEDSQEINKFNQNVVRIGNQEKYSAFKLIEPEKIRRRALPFGDAALYPIEDRYVVIGKPKNAGWSEIVIVVVFSLIILRINRELKPRRRLSPSLGGIIMSTPFVFASAATFIIMMVFEIPLDVATAVMTALSINASADFAIYFVRAFIKALLKADKDKAVVLAMRDRGEIILNDMVLNSLCFSYLISSPFPAIRRLGLMLVLMIIMCCIGTLVIMPSMLRCAVDFRWRYFLKEVSIKLKIRPIGF